MAGNNVRVGVGVTGVGKSSSELDKFRDKFDKLQKQGAKGVMAGVGAAATLKAFSIVGTAVDEFTNVLGDSIEAAKEEEISIQKLGSSLKANVPAWDGQTKAIEDVLAARMKLGFADDEQRQSLATLLTATHDVTKALDIQRTAMDLARLRNIDLQSATDILTKVYAGNVGILSRYGIMVKKGSTATEALAQIQRAAAGQAEDYARTNTGKLLVSQVAVSEAMEKFGGKVLPLVAEGASIAADKITEVAGVLDALDGVTIPGVEGSVKGLAETFADFADPGKTLDPLGRMTDALDFAADAVDGLGVNTDQARKIWSDFGLVTSKASDEVTTSAEKMKGSIDWASDQSVASFEDVGDASKKMASDVKSSARRAADYYSTLRDSVVDDTETMIDDAFDPLETRLEEQGNHFRILSAIESRESAKGKEAVVSANDDIVNSLDDQAQTLVDLGKRHKLTSKDVDKYEADVVASYKAMGKKIPPEIQKVITKLRTLAGFDGKHIRYTIDISQRTGVGGKVAGKKAAGGTVAAGATYLVGENGPELFTPSGAGGIVPNDKMSAMGGNTYNFNLTVQGNLTAPNEEAVLRTMRRLQGIARPMAIHG